MTKPTDEAATTRMWRDTFTAMAECGIDPGEAADAMLTVAGLMVERHLRHRGGEDRARGWLQSPVSARATGNAGAGRGRAALRGCRRFNWTDDAISASLRIRYCA